VERTPNMQYLPWISKNGLIKWLTCGIIFCLLWHLASLSNENDSLGKKETSLVCFMNKTDILQNPVRMETPMTFDFLVDYTQRIKSGLLVEKLSRTKYMQEKYDEYNKKQCGDLDVMQTYLNDCDVNLSLNSFPYNIEDNISHYILWIKDGIKLDIPEYIRLRFGTRRTVIFTNPPEWKSIPNIIHHHIFVEEYKCKL
jgi:uncharacterized protein DUF3605